MTQKTINLSDIYVKKGEINLPTKTSDLLNDGSNGIDAYITQDDISNAQTTSNMTQSVTNTADKYPSSKAVYDALQNKANSTHTHAWINVKQTGDSSLSDALVIGLYVNAEIRLCQLRFNHLINSAKAFQYYEWSSLKGWVPSSYRPTIQSSGSTNAIGTITVTPNGDIIGRFGESWGNSGDTYDQPRTIIATIYWRY